VAQISHTKHVGLGERQKRDTFERCKLVRENQVTVENVHCVISILEVVGSA